MYRTFLQEVLNEDMGLLPLEYADTCIYVVRDDEVVFYGGQSTDPLYRLQQHMGFERNLPSRLGQFIRDNQPESNEWVVDCYTLQECQELIAGWIAGEKDEQMRILELRVALADAKITERYMIMNLHPCLNTFHNQNPHPLPTKYKNTTASNISSALYLHLPEKSGISPQAVTTLGQVLRQLPPTVRVRPVQTLYLLLGQHGWMNGTQALDLLAHSRSVDGDWDAYLIENEATELRGIYLFGPGKQAHRAFELSQ